MTARHRVPPSALCMPRSSLNQTCHAFVDSALKDLKIYSRRLKIVLAAHADELQILERLYYKGKNQHRAGLFWCRMAGIRKFCGRLGGMRMCSVIDDFRCSFFAQVQNIPKISKGPWTHFPDIKYVSFVAERISACGSLLEKMHQRLLEASRHFILAMQSGAFVQLLLALVGITSRIDILISELQDVLMLIRSAVHRIFQALNPDAADRSMSSHVPDSLFSVMTGDLKKSDIDLPSYDLGQTAYYSISKQSVFTPAVESWANGIPVSGDLTTDGQSSVARDWEPVVLERKTAVNAPAAVPFTTMKTERSGGDGEQKDKIKRKRKKRDEIDDIFGF